MKRPGHSVDIARPGLLLLLCLLFLAGRPAAADPDALWKIVSGHCVPGMQHKSDPKPCTAVDLDGGFAVLKDLRGVAQFLLIPTDRVTGIESPVLLQPDAPNYWQAAWQARHYLAGMLNRAVPREDVALAINSATGRSQNQLHIHIDCLRPDVQRLLHDNEGRIGTTWAVISAPMVGHDYMARRLESEDLARDNPFLLLAEGVPGARDAMAKQTLAVIGAVFADGSHGFYLLNDHVDLVHGDAGSSEELLDHDCALLGGAAKGAKPRT